VSAAEATASAAATAATDAAGGVFCTVFTRLASAADGVPVGELSARLFALFAGFSVAN
jgi:hypothetical protein